MSCGSFTLSPIKRISGKVDLPGSKSLSNRVLLLSMLAEGTTHILNLLDSDDVRYMIGALEQLGIRMEETRGSNEIRVEGCAAKIPNSDLELMLGNAGTAIRPLTAALTLGQGRYELDGVPRMRERRQVRSGLVPKSKRQSKDGLQFQRCRASVPNPNSGS